MHFHSNGKFDNIFQMLLGENISDVKKHFTHVVNHLLALGKTMEKQELNVKVLKSLN